MRICMPPVHQEAAEKERFGSALTLGPRGHLTTVMDGKLSCSPSSWGMQVEKRTYTYLRSRPEASGSSLEEIVSGCHEE